MSGRPNTVEARIGLLHLTDAAPVIVAQEFGLFAEQGIDVELFIEPSWANVADKLAYGLLDAAVILPPLAFAVSLGLRGPATPLLVPMALSLNGNSITFDRATAAAIRSGTDRAPGALDLGRRLLHHLRTRQERMRLAVVHRYSTHNLLLRYWLAASGIDPDRDLDIEIVPPVDMVGAMIGGRIHGFCAGMPWGEVAARAGVGEIVLSSAQVWANHPEKCLAVRRDWAERDSGALQRLLVSLLEAARQCDQPARADEIAAILAAPAYLGIAAEIVRSSLPVEPANESARERSVFFGSAAMFPWPSHAAWMLAEMDRWGLLGAGVDREAAIRELYRPDIFRGAAGRAGVAAPLADGKVEGAHGEPWLQPGAPQAIAMAPDLFCDGRTFDAAALAKV